MDANQAEERAYHQQPHNIKLVTKKGFHVDGTIDGSLQTFMQNIGLTNILRQCMKASYPTNIHGDLFK
jgi:hypothetical protein